MLFIFCGLVLTLLYWLPVAVKYPKKNLFVLKKKHPGTSWLYHSRLKIINTGTTT